MAQYVLATQENQRLERWIQNLLEQQNLTRTTAVSSMPPDREKPGFVCGLDGHHAASHDLMQLWSSVGSILKAADVFLESKYVTDAEDRPELFVYTITGHQDGQHEFGVSCSRSCSYPTGGFGSTSCLELSVNTIENHFTSYMERIYDLHPFLDAAELRRIFDGFIVRHHPNPGPSHLIGVHDESGNRWKYQGQHQRLCVTRERLPSDAMVFLILALGEICAHTNPLPATELDWEGGKFDLSAIPGLEYYGRAVEIIRSGLEGYELLYAQTFLLAGLYTAQLLRAKESMNWFTRAGRILRSLIEEQKLSNDEPWKMDGSLRKQFEESRKLVTNSSHRLILLCAWSCRLLERENCTKLPLPSSGLCQIEELLPIPQSRVEKHGLSPSPPTPTTDQDLHHARILSFYVAQIFLERQFTQVYNELYGRKRFDWSPKGIREKVRIQEVLLQGWRDGIPSGLKWSNSDPPPSDILPARLRARYWETRHLYNRPFLDYALHIMPHVKKGFSARDVALDVNGRPREEADIRTFEAIALMSEDELWQGCRRCVEAARQRITAFDGVLGRLIITNIHGAAHV